MKPSFDWLSFLRWAGKSTPQPRPPREKREKASPKEYLITLPDETMFARLAFTKSEARAMVKQKLGLQRLPVGTRIRCLGVMREAA